MMDPNADQHSEHQNPTADSNMSGEIPVIRWKNRRTMAWYAFWILVVSTMAYWFILPLWFSWFELSTTWLAIIGESYFWFVATLGTVILGYMGFTTLPFVGKGRGRRQDVQMSDEDY